MDKKISRRQLLIALTAAMGGVGLYKVLGMPLLQGTAQELDEHVYLPIIRNASTATSTATPTSTPTATPTATPTGSPSGSRVVHVHDEDATFWDFGDDYYGDFVDQATVNEMVDQGVRGLFEDQVSVEQAWRTLVPSYAPGKAIAIKVNFNNCYWCDSSSTVIDALVHPINPVINGLLRAYDDFQTSDIWVYDATFGGAPPGSHRQIPQRFKDDCLYSGVRFFSPLYQLGACNEIAGYDSSDPSANITWHNPGSIPTPPSAKVTDVLVDATYVINMPIIKRHGSGAQVTLSFKNHLGSIADPSALHPWIMGDYFDLSYNPMVDIYRNSNIANKTVLTIGDGLFGNKVDNLSKPSRWSSFGNQAPNSLLFSTDPVAIDCVMSDLLHAEVSFSDRANRMLNSVLIYANSVGLGTFERGDPWGSGYTQIVYLKIEL